ncbi:MAG: redoxin domain-containing protein [Planctomycetes bacterium]|nr:redoxin domain-containing protein [Planctomycetota bacterium]
MVRTESTMLTLGTPAPDFALPNVDGNVVKLSDFAGKPVLVMFICNHCPFVKHLASALAEFGREYQKNGLAIVAINANDVANYPDDAPDMMAAESRQRGYTFPYLYDASQDVAREYRAACTPDFFLFDKDHKLAYRGQFDDTRPTRISSGVYDSSKNMPTGADLRRAADAVLAGRSVPEPHYPSVGCNIKWKAGNAPAYFGG